MYILYFLRADKTVSAYAFAGLFAGHEGVLGAGRGDAWAHFPKGISPFRAAAQVE